MNRFANTDISDRLLGNRREMFHGLIGNAKWGGVRLRDLLGDARVQDAGIEVVFNGSDKGSENIRNVDVEQTFGRSMNIDDAQRADVMVAYKMNGVPVQSRRTGAPHRAWLACAIQTNRDDQVVALQERAAPVECR